MADPAPLPLRRALAALTLVGVSFGFTEAATVVYVRCLYEPLHQRLHPARGAGDLFPFIPLERLHAPGMDHVDLPAAELSREAATLFLLAGAALAVARNARQWLAAFVFAFGVWDVFYYVFLYWLIGWPTSLLEWDILFLVPLPWVGPVLAPALVAVVMAAAGAAVLWREAQGRPVVLAARHWLGLAAGGTVLVAAFCWDYRNTLAGGMPEWFNWPVYAAGLGVGVGTFLHAFARRPSPVGVIDEVPCTQLP